MKKQKLFLSVLLSLFLLACGGVAEVDALPPAAVDTSESSVVVEENNDAAPAAEETAESNTEGSAAAVELPQIPDVSFFGDEWFQPTPVDQVALASGQVQLFDFSAIWCTYCRQMAPVIEGLEQLYGDRINFVMIDIDQDGANAYGPFITALEYDPRFRPGIYILGPSGEVLARWLGPVAGPIIQEQLVLALETYP
jgi:thiol-disulfide isomerase/thioredoxin